MIFSLTNPAATGPELVDQLSIRLGGETVILHASKGAYLPEHHTLLVADVHLGKAASFRRLGVPVPSGTTDINLRRLNLTIEQFKPQRLIVLGDLIHAERSHSNELHASLREWRAQHSLIKVDLVEGNHDFQAGHFPADLKIGVLQEPYCLGGLALCHHPKSIEGKTVVCGHVHPVFHLQGKGRGRVRLPCFHWDAQRLTLPSFGEFTGGHAVEHTGGVHVAVVVADQM